MGPATGNHGKGWGQGVDDRETAWEYPVFRITFSGNLRENDI